MTAPTTLPRGRQIPPLEPGSDEWLRHMSASKIAAVLGLSPYESRFSLWHRMAGQVPAEPDSDLLRRGHYLEPAIAAWFADQHPEFVVNPAGTFVSPHDDDFTATPDRLLHRPLMRVDGAEFYVREPLALLECKSAADTDEWGEPGTDQVPVGYRAQVMWQMDCAGIDVCHIAVLTAYLEFVEYVVHYDADEAAFLRAEGRAFLDSLPTGPKPTRPDLDAHTATYQAVRQLHPDIEDVDVELDPALAKDFCTSKTAADQAARDFQHAKTRVADALGSGRRARLGKQTIATRQAKGAGVPYLVAGRSLPTFED